MNNETNFQKIKKRKNRDVEKRNKNKLRKPNPFKE